MRIGLLRHFPVDEPFPSTRITAAELQAWRVRYEAAQARIGDFDLGGIEWQKCISSDSPRAAITASTVFRGEIEHTALLQEAQFTEFASGDLRLSFWAWRQVLRFCWLSGHASQRACRDDFKSRVAAMADRVCAQEGDVLVVSHAGMMAYLSRELRRRGFAGPSLRIADHARVYLYERN